MSCRPVQCTHSHSCCSHSCALYYHKCSCISYTHLRSKITRNLIHLLYMLAHMTQQTGSIPLIIVNKHLHCVRVQTMIWLPTIMWLLVPPSFLYVVQISKYMYCTCTCSYVSKIAVLIPHVFLHHCVIIFHALLSGPHPPTNTWSHHPHASIHTHTCLRTGVWRVATLLTTPLCPPHYWNDALLVYWPRNGEVGCERVALMKASWSGDMHNYLHIHASLTYMYTHVLKHPHMTGWLPMAGNGPVPYGPREVVASIPMGP